MKRHPVKSESIISIGYDEHTHELEIEFQGGRVYVYESVPIAAYRLLEQAPSIGRYVNTVIKPRFVAREV